MLKEITYEVVGKKWGSFTSKDSGEVIQYRHLMVMSKFDPPQVDRDEHVIGRNIELMKCPNDQESVDCYKELSPGDTIEVLRNAQGRITAIGLVKKATDEKSQQQSFTAKVG